MRYKEYIWDFDGTLFDSYPHTCEVFWQVMGEEGLQVGHTKDEIMSYLLVSFYEAKRVAGMSDEAYDRFFEIVHYTGEKEIKPAVVPFDDCEKVLKAVVDAGGRNFLYTHRGATAKYFLDIYDYSKYFTDMVMAEEGFPSKPAPDALNSLIERNNLRRADCVMIGDREIDGESGHNAGIAGALVNFPEKLPDGSDTEKVSKMEFIAHTLTEIATILNVPVE